MPAGKISEDTVTAIRSALEDGCYREVFRLVGIAWIDRKTLLNWLKRGERERSGLYRDLYLAVERAESRKLSG